jgi:hypothetical protein
MKNYCWNNANETPDENVRVHAITSRGEHCIAYYYAGAWRDQFTGDIINIKRWKTFY